MNKEFPQLEEHEVYKEFLTDWWSPKKLFKGYRGSGKSTLMLCEAKRFSDVGFDILVLGRTVQSFRELESKYSDLFGEKPTFEFGSYGQLENGSLRGMKVDVVIMDEVQNVEKDMILTELIPMNPLFIRASACKSGVKNLSYLSDEKESGFFDSVYEQ